MPVAAAGEEHVAAVQTMLAPAKVAVEVPVTAVQVAVVLLPPVCAWPSLQAYWHWALSAESAMQLLPVVAVSAGLAHLAPVQTSAGVVKAAFDVPGVTAQVDASSPVPL